MSNSHNTKLAGELDDFKRKLQILSGENTDLSGQVR